MTKTIEKNRWPENKACWLVVFVWWTELKLQASRGVVGEDGWGGDYVDTHVLYEGKGVSLNRHKGIIPAENIS